MKLALCLALAFVFVASCFCDDDAAWEHYKEENHLKYKDHAQEEEHKANFLEVTKLVKQSVDKSKTRAGKDTVVMKVHSLSHLSKDEKTNGLFGLIHHPSKPKGPKAPKNSTTRKMNNRLAGHPVDDEFAGWLPFPGEPPGNPKPAAIDWMGMGKINTPGYSQNPCGSCWAFSGSAVIESHYLLRYGNPIKLSEQFFRDCSFDSHFATAPRVACEGAFLETAMQLASEAPIPKIEDYPYKQDDQVRQCPLGKAGFKLDITGIARVEGEEEMMAALRTVGPLVVAMDANELAHEQRWFNWNGQNPSVYPAEQCTEETNHAVTLIGYGTDQKYGPYWVIRNSWGPKWGNKGTFRLPRGRCGIDAGVYPCFGGKCHHGRIILEAQG